MGYVTQYSLKWEIANEADEMIGTAAVIREAISKEQSAFAFALCKDGSCKNTSKWHGHEADMRELSKKVPHVVFELSGEGEDQGDVWRKQFLNGKMQTIRAELKFPKWPGIWT